MVPDYPIFEMRLSITKDDTLHYSARAWIGMSSFIIPVWEGWISDFVYFDSISLNGRRFFEVYRIKKHDNYYNNNEPDGIYPDSLWYNTSQGILKVLMSNGEYYQINEQSSKL
ncbi:MAG: hypothetical protein GY790_10845 [Bacteroidetes bacterium]|nr:hypothetical protein [Bacteroidota bacterium]